MRFVLSLALLGLVIAQSPARDDEADKARRRAEIQKEIDELQGKIAKLSAELAKLQPAPAVSREAAFQGMISTWAIKPEEGFLVGWNEAVPASVRSERVVEQRIVRLRKDTQVRYSDKQPAKPSDLKFGQCVNVRGKVDLADPLKVEADVIVIEKAARRIAEGKDAKEVAKQVNFAKEYLVVSRIEGVADDELWFAVTHDKDGPLVHFTFVPGRAKGPDGHILFRIHAISKEARIAGGAGAKKITSVEELAKALRDAVAADKEPVAAVVRKMRDREECTLELHIKKTGEKFDLPPPNGITEPWVLERAFAGQGEGDLVATVRFVKDGQSFTLVSKGLTEDLFAVRYLRVENRFPKWYGPALAEIKSSAEVQRYEIGNNNAVFWVRIAEPSKQMAEALGYARAKYDAKRSELMKRFHNVGGYRNDLWYAPSQDMKWEILRDGKTLYIRTLAARVGSSATFLIEFQEAKDGAWRYVRLLASESFHGE
jgi:hypothetical protein